MQTSEWYAKLEMSLKSAKERSSCNWASLATVRCSSSGDLCGRPSNRTVNIRSVSEKECRIVSDTRSGKARDVQEGSSPYAELCWLFPETMMQFRISGRLGIIKQGPERDAFWKQIEPEQRKWWTWPAPGTPREEPHGPYPGDEKASFIENIPDCFCVCVLEIDFVDMLDLKRNPFLRETFTKVNNRDEDSSRKWFRQLVHP